MIYRKLRMAGVDYDGSFFYYCPECDQGSVETLDFGAGEVHLNCVECHWRLRIVPEGRPKRRSRKSLLKKLLTFIGF